MAERLEAAQIEAQSNNLGLWAPDACGPAADADLRIVDLVADAEGDDNQNLNGELVKVRNIGANLVDMKLGYQQSISLQPLDLPDRILPRTW